MLTRSHRIAAASVVCYRKGATVQNLNCVCTFLCFCALWHCLGQKIVSIYIKIKKRYDNIVRKLIQSHFGKVREKGIVFIPKRALI